MATIRSASIGFGLRQPQFNFFTLHVPTSGSLRSSTSCFHQNSEIALSDIKAKRKDLGIPTLGSFKAAEPYGIVYREDPKEKKTNKKNNRCSSEGPTLGTTEPDSTVEQLEREIGGFTSTEAETPITQENKVTKYLSVLKWRRAHT